jgi:hypothetical protein
MWRFPILRTNDMRRPATDVSGWWCEDAWPMPLLCERAGRVGSAFLMTKYAFGARPAPSLEA